MVKVHAQKEFTDEQIKRQREIAKTDPDQKKRDRAKRAVLEMQAYNMRALRGDFDSY